MARIFYSVCAPGSNHKGMMVDGKKMKEFFCQTVLTIHACSHSIWITDYPQESKDEHQVLSPFTSSVDYGHKLIL